MWAHTSGHAASLLAENVTGRERINALHAVVSYQSASAPEALEAMAEAAELLSLEDDDYVKGWADHTYLEAILALHHYDWVGAQEQFWTAVGLYQQCHDIDGVFATSVLLANGSALEGQFNEALRSLEAVTELEETYGCTSRFPEERLATIYYDIGTTMFELGLYQQAKHRLNQARELGLVTGARPARVGAPFVLARIAATEGDRRHALELQHEAVDACHESEVVWRHLSLMQLSELYLADRNLERAEAILDTAEALGERVPMSLAHVRVDMARAELHLQKGEAEAALEVAGRAVEFLAPRGHRKLGDGIELLARAQTAVGNDREASRLWREAATIARHRSPTRAGQRSLAAIDDMPLSLGTADSDSTSLLIRQFSVAKAQLRTALDNQAALAFTLGHDARIVITNAQLLVERHLVRQPNDEEIRSVLGLLDALTELITTTTASWRRMGSVSRDSCDPRVCAAEAVDLVAPSLTERGLIVVQTNDASVSNVRMPHAILRNALTNLLANAIEHSFSDGEISIQMTEESGSVTVSVLDSGIGANVERLALLNDPTVPASTSPRGMGIRQTREQLAQFGSELVLYSEGPGKGLRAQFDVPIAGADGDLASAPSAELLKQRDERPH